MSRSIDISYREKATGTEVSIEVPDPYHLLGPQRSSMRFWGSPRMKEVGISRLSILGVCDPVYFNGWEEMVELRRELALLDEHLSSMEGGAAAKASYLSHMVYCYHLLIETAPSDSVPVFGIG